MSKKRKRMSGYKKSLIIFTIILFICGEFILIYVNNSLKAYEKSDIDNYLNSLLTDIQKSSQNGNIKKYFSLAKVSSPYEKKSSLEKGYKDLLKDAKLTYKKTDEKNIYDLYADDLLIGTVTLDGSKEEKRLGLLTFNVWEIAEMQSYNDEGLYSFDFYLNSDYKLYINNNLVKNDDLVGTEKIEGFEDAYDYVDLPKLNHYKVKGLTAKPEIVIKDKSDKTIDAQVKGSEYFASDFYHTDSLDDAYKKLANKDFDPLLFAENWSKFLTADLDGNRWGLYTLTPNLIEGTTMYKRAYSWATQIDIQFTSIHDLDKVPFTNEKVSNITVYNDKAFSVEIYLEKNMTLSDGQKKTDTLHDIFYYVFYQDAYRLISMKSVTEGGK
ncbi:MAG: hypothetical protein IKR74_02345 [Bacilli bacterium]|nr:hypothetical protein [Bacilli bacterium]